jgi:hypothetical protein
MMFLGRTPILRYDFKIYKSELCWCADTNGMKIKAQNTITAYASTRVFFQKTHISCDGLPLK